jgi:signal peptidase II
MNKYKVAIFISLFIVIADQLTKWAIRANLTLFERIPVLPFLDITHIRNKGAAFGILNDLPGDVRMPLFVLVLLLAVIVIFVFLSKTDSKDRLLVYSLSLILGGAIGNSIDRFRLGYVTDFIDFHWFGDPRYHWPPFNFADSAITIGVILILFDAFFLKRGR